MVVAFVRMDGLENCVNTQGNVTWPKMRAEVSVNQPMAYYAQERVSKWGTDGCFDWPCP